MLLTKARILFFMDMHMVFFLKNTISLKGFIGEALQLHKEHHILLYFSSLAQVF